MRPDRTTTPTSAPATMPMIGPADELDDLGVVEAAAAATLGVGVAVTTAVAVMGTIEVRDEDDELEEVDLVVEDVEVDEGVEEVEEEEVVERVVLLEVSPNKKLVRSSMNPAEVEVEVAVVVGL